MRTNTSRKINKLDDPGALRQAQIFYVGDWQVNAELGEVSCGTQVIRLEPKVIDVLVYLAQHAGQVVTRDDLERNVWAGTIVSYDALTVTINKLRKALKDNPRAPHVIETLSKKGYRLIAEVNFDVPGAEADQVDDKGNVLETVATDKNVPPEKTRPGSFYIALLAIVLTLVVTIVTVVIKFGNDQLPSATTNSDTLLSSAENKQFIAVLPFSNISNDRNQDYIANGVTEYLITDLSRLSSLSVISRSSVAGYSSASANIAQISKELNVRYVLTGSVQKIDDRLRVAIQLIDSKSNAQVWADRFDTKAESIFNIFDEIVEKIVSQLVVQVSHSQQANAARKYTANLEALDYYMRGRALYTTISKESNHLARKMFDRAINIDPEFAGAYSAQALTYIDDYRRKWVEDTQAAVDQAVTLADKAITIDGTAAVGHWVLGYVNLYGRKKPLAAIKSAEQAIMLYPSYADGYALLASAYSFSGRSEEAILINQQAMRLNPNSSYVYFANLGRDYYFVGDLSKAIISLESAIYRNDNYLNAHLYLAAAYVKSHRMDDVAWEVDKVLTLDPDFSLNYWASTQPYTSDKRRDLLVADMRRAGLPD